MRSDARRLGLQLGHAWVQRRVEVARMAAETLTTSLATGGLTDFLFFLLYYLLEAARHVFKTLINK